MFYETLLKLCHENNISLTTFITDQLHMSSGNITKWRTGNVPRSDTVSKIADYFGVTTDYLLNGGAANSIKIYDEDDNIVVLDDEAREMIDQVRKRPEMKILFSVSKKASKDDIINAIKIIEALKDKKEGV